MRPLGALLLVCLVACMAKDVREPAPEWQIRQQKMNEITTHRYM